MKLETYIKSHGLSDARFGAQIGISQSQVSRIKRGLCWPSKEVVRAIAIVTQNKVTAIDLANEERVAS